ncbi:MAG: hypothetical protein HY650_06760 [Acidobacteria bacterium]|nr:hypothetical protein [Acidobacteriota bacterium]
MPGIGLVRAVALLTILFMTPGLTFSQGPSAGEILERAVEAAGGAANLSKLRSLRAWSVNIRSDLGQSYAPAWNEDPEQAAHEHFITDTYVDFSNDALQIAPRKPRLHWVSKVETLTDGIRRIDVLPVKNGHADGMLAVFVRDAGVLFVSDLFPSDDRGLRQAVADLVAERKLQVQTIAPSHGAAQSWEQFLKTVSNDN